MNLSSSCLHSSSPPHTPLLKWSTLSFSIAFYSKRKALKFEEVMGFLSLFIFWKCSRGMKTLFLRHCKTKITRCKQDKPGPFCGKLKSALNLRGLKRAQDEKWRRESSWMKVRLWERVNCSVSHRRPSPSSRLKLICQPYALGSIYLDSLNA